MPVVDHEAFVPPADDVSVWRYLDLARFAAMVTTRSIYFSRITALGDRFEGAFTKKFVSDVVREQEFLPEGKRLKNAQTVLELNREMVERCLVSCWHAGEVESDAMWRIYGQTSGIAIRSSIRRLKESLLTASGLLIGEVKYVDYSQATFPLKNVMWPAIHKRAAFAHEREVRMVMITGPTDDTPVLHVVDASGRFVREFPLDPDARGVSVSADLDRLISKIVVAPEAPRWYLDVVNSLMSMSGVHKRAEFSELSIVPIRDLAGLDETHHGGERASG